MSGRHGRTLQAKVLVAVVAVVQLGLAACTRDDAGAPESTSAPVERDVDVLLACESPSGIRLHDGTGASFGVVSRNELDGELDWSPNGQAIAFQRGSESFVVGVDGLNETRLAVGGSPRWSRDGKRIALHRASDTGAAILVVDADGQNLRVVATEAGRSPATWSPDGSKLVFASPRGVTVVDAAGGVPRVLHQGYATEALWSPDGTTIAYTASNLVPSPDTDVPGSSQSLFVVDADGSNPRALISGLSPEPILGGWWPDGSRIVYFAAETLHTITLSGEKSTITPLPGLQMQLSSLVSWSPGGQFLTFSVMAFANYIVGADGSNGHLFETDYPVASQCWEAWYRPIRAPVPPSVASATTQPPPLPPTAPGTWEEYVGLEFHGFEGPPLLAGATHLGWSSLLSVDFDLFGYGVDHAQQGNTHVLLFSLGLAVDWIPRTMFGPRWRVVDVLVLPIEGEWNELHNCTVDGHDTSNIVTYLQFLTADEYQTPTLAWRFDTTTQQAEPVDPSRVICHFIAGDHGGD